MKSASFTLACFYVTVQAATNLTEFVTDGLMAYAGLNKSQQ